MYLEILVIFYRFDSISNEVYYTLILTNMQQIQKVIVEKYDVYVTFFYEL